MKSLVLFVFIVIMLAGVVLWRGFFIPAPPPPPKYFMIYDQSPSKMDGCGDVKEYARRQILKATRKGEKVFFYVLGTSANGFQPRLVWQFEIPKDDRTMSNPQDVQNQIARSLTELETKCRAVEPVNETPLFEAMKRVIEQIRPDCLPGVCNVFVQSDLEETVEKPLIEAFNAEKQGKKPAVLPKQIDNTGISITFSGISEIVVKTGKNPNVKNTAKLGNSDVWQKVWQKVFVQTDNLVFRPLSDSGQDNASMASVTK